jgi:hypothetical protein
MSIVISTMPQIYTKVSEVPAASIIYLILLTTHLSNIVVSKQDLKTFGNWMLVYVL